MFCVIQKKEYFDWCEQGYVDLHRLDIKAAQDAWILSRLGQPQNMKIAEIGGGDSRVLKRVKDRNECWNIDKLQGQHGGPQRGNILFHEGVRYVEVFMGDFSSAIPDGYFDVVYSISVIEHVPREKIAPFFQDVSRILKPGGRAYHAIDYYIGDTPRESVDENLQAIEVESCRDTGLSFETNPGYDKPLLFKSFYVSNSDMAMQLWNQMAPNLREVRENCQAVSLKGIWNKR